MKKGSIKRESVEDRIKANSVVSTSGCWVWTGARTKNGYGTFALTRGHSTTAHRASYETFIGPALKGLDVCHKCDKPYCVNPEHLFLGTRSENMRDCVAKGRNKNIKRRQGAELHHATLTDEQARSIYIRARAGESGAALGREFKVHKNTVYSVRHGKTYTIATKDLQNAP